MSIYIPSNFVYTYIYTANLSIEHHIFMLYIISFELQLTESNILDWCFNIWYSMGYRTHNECQRVYLPFFKKPKSFEH